MWSQKKVVLVWQMWLQRRNHINKAGVLGWDGSCALRQARGPWTLSEPPTPPALPHSFPFFSLSAELTACRWNKAKPEPSWSNHRNVHGRKCAGGFACKHNTSVVDVGTQPQWCKSRCQIPGTFYTCTQMATQTGIVSNCRTLPVVAALQYGQNYKPPTWSVFGSLDPHWWVIE